MCSMEYFQILSICPSLNIHAKKLVFSHGTSSWFCLNLNLIGWYASVFLYLFIFLTKISRQVAEQTLINDVHDNRNMIFFLSIL